MPPVHGASDKDTCICTPVHAASGKDATCIGEEVYTYASDIACSCLRYRDYLHRLRLESENTQILGSSARNAFSQSLISFPTKKSDLVEKVLRRIVSSLRV